jgi:hypothetical protein
MADAAMDELPVPVPELTIANVVDDLRFLAAAGAADSVSDLLASFAAPREVDADGYTLVRFALFDALGHALGAAIGRFIDLYGRGTRLDPIFEHFHQWNAANRVFLDYLSCKVIEALSSPGAQSG